MKLSLPQLRKIQMLRKALKLDDGEYYGLLESYGVNHCNELTFGQAGLVIKSLEETAVGCGIWEKKDSPKKYDHLKNREPEMATPAQLRKIDAMWNDVSYAPVEKRETALRKFLFGLVHVSDMRFLTMEKVRKVIRALETMKKQKELAEASRQRAAKAS